MSNIQKNFLDSFKLYENKFDFLSQNITWKLDLILNLIQGKIPKKQIFTLQRQLQYEDLLNMNQVALKLIFINIINTLVNKQEICNIHCCIKKRGIFSVWLGAIISKNQNSFFIKYLNKTKKYQIQQCQLKKSKQSKKVLELYHKKQHKYSMRFENEQSMLSIFKSWQQQIIKLKSGKNYQLMQTMFIENSPKQMRKVNLLHNSSFKDMKSPDSKFQKSLSSQLRFQEIIHSQTKSPQHKVYKQNKNEKLFKPIPYGYIKKFENKNLILALKSQNESKIYIEFVFKPNIEIKIVIVSMILQKQWNQFLIFENIERSLGSKDELTIQRKFDTFDKIGEFIEINMKVLCTSWGENMYMISGQSLEISQQEKMIEKEQKRLESRFLITIQRQQQWIKIHVEDEIRSEKYGAEELNEILMKMYEDLSRLQFVYNKINFVNVEAFKFVEKILEAEQLTNNEFEVQQNLKVSHDDEFQMLMQKQHHLNLSDQIIETSLNYKDLNQFTSSQNKPDNQSSLVTSKFKNKTDKKIQDNLSDYEVKMSTLNQNIIQNQIQSQTVSNIIPLRLNSPLQIPNQNYIHLVQKKEFQKKYFNFSFSQKILTQYDAYTPHYQLNKMIQNKLYQILPSSELKFIDKKLLQSQKQVLKFVLYQLGANLISGKSIVNVSLPVDIFEPRTGLQRSASSFATCPDFLLSKAYSSPLQQIKYVTGFIISIISSELVMQKPFNPVLGQTFEGYIKGIPIYYEQICHNPPISAYFMTCPQFKIYGNLIPYAQVGLNTGNGGNLGPMYINFANGCQFQCYFPPSQIAGLIYGDRKFRCYNKGFILQKKNSIYSEFSLQNQKKGVYEADRKLKVGQLIGGIFKVKQEFFNQIQKFKASHKSLKKFGGITKQFILEKHHSISGQWFGKIKIDDEVINENIKLYPIEYSKNVLPSDSNFRLDVLYHKCNRLKDSQKSKQEIQECQRGDKKLREKYAVIRRNKQKNTIKNI